VATLNQEETIITAAKGIVDKGKELGLRVELDDSNESVGKKIREAELMRVPYTVVIGNKELESQKVLPRARGDLPPISAETGVGEFLQKVAQDAKARK
jgi:threonyl-tRNA synthetase